MHQHLKHHSMRALCQAFASHQGRAGAPSLRHDIQAQGMPCSERTVGRTLAKLGLRAKGTHKFRHASSKKHSLATAPNLLGRQFNLAKPNQVWVWLSPVQFEAAYYLL